MIALCNISVGYGEKRVLQHVSFKLPEKGAAAIGGPSGSGKTTLLRALAGLIPLQEGHIEGLSNKRISMVFQEDRLLPWRTALENVLLVLPEQDAMRQETAQAWLVRMELQAELHAYPPVLSGGQRQRVALARACAYGGDVLLLDEPFQGLDAALRARIAPYIQKAAPLIVLVTHDEEDAAILGAQGVWDIT